jgi:hypothetical protein
MSEPLDKQQDEVVQYFAFKMGEQIELRSSPWKQSLLARVRADWLKLLGE